MPTLQGSGTWADLKGATFTVTIASPGVFTLTAHGLVAGDAIVFQTTGALPTGLTAGTTYYVIAAGLTANAFEVSTTIGGSAVNTSGSQSGTHSVTSVEHTLLDVAVAGTYVLEVDKTNMAAGDLTELRIKAVMLTGGALKGVYFTRAADAAVTDDMVEVSVPIPNDLTDSPSVRFTIKQPGGTGRNYDWKVQKL